ncbi:MULTISPECIES: cation diffusion facilitator family transporter [unclassified Methylophaga]|jgi:cobalt-zinc-cadmium efflux system protein|uniref:cation diffusion facilitator family transporter n=1 Tax=unclassified Methylophaga TaxID=2629249 RepID=UPI000C92B765|nr:MULTISPECIES: cation diffusion facilitator family transporter [unclassified Methylophaga]MAK66369.1 cation transporter [Methylophaga sp.]MAY17063.1 cation transporter [Methylophaga sp.]MBN46148.1 cation transporter [Methylophaga sp.]HAO26134.1 cation transporter [Methylophaga sp.]HCD06284.1 cation transporter [Methylophaga sp.]|tara:strand:+ start:4422 stop:5336 length:915 start_codon:yes stop_codon:yes gene_type:complete
MEHSHPHHHQVANYNRAFAIGILLNVVFVIIEASYGILAGSMALLADAGHNLSDVVSLLLAWGASVLAKKAATEKRTYGFRKATVMAALLSSIMLLIALGGIAWESINRMFNPQPVQGMTVIVVASIGVVINTITALLFFKGQQHDLNIRGAFLHMAADAAVSLGVVIAGIFILFKNWLWIDPLVSLLIVMIILIGTWRLLRESLNYAMDAVPENVDLQKIQQYLLDCDQVDSLHDLHVWPLSTSETALTVHLVVKGSPLDNAFLSQLQHDLHDHFAIEHATIQLESADDASFCLLGSNHDCHH